MEELNRVEESNSEVFKLTEQFKGQFFLNEPLSSHTSWHIGGPAKYYFRPVTSDDLSVFLKNFTRTHPDEPLIWLGLGSNVLIADRGIEGLVVHTLGMNNFLEIEKQNEGQMDSVIVKVGAGVPCAKLAKFAAKQGLLGAEFFAGIPGTIGGALTMNAGAFGGETWRVVIAAEVITRQGEIIKRLPQEYDISYRSVKKRIDKLDKRFTEKKLDLPLMTALPDKLRPEKKEEYENDPHPSDPNPSECFVTGYFRFEKGDIESASQKIKQLLKKRNETQPIGSFNCGSVFKNPPNDFAARLIEASGLKGYKLGEAQISPIHANFIINLGQASAKQILTLMQLIIKKVYENNGIILSPEVRFLGFRNDELQEYLKP